jgi:hypothetical protein
VVETAVMSLWKSMGAAVDKAALAFDAQQSDFLLATEASLLIHLLDNLFHRLFFFLHLLGFLFGKLEFLYFVLQIRNIISLSINTFLSEIVDFNDILL